MFISMFAILSFLVLGTANAEEKITIGAVEDVILLPWGVRLPARIELNAHPGL
jgi:hypothetical protein